MIKKMLFVLLCFLLLGFIGFAEGQQEGASEGVKQVTLNTWGWNITIDAFNGVYDEYKKTHPNVKLETSEFEFGAMHDKLKATLASGTGAPDFVPIAQYYVQQIAQNGGLLDVTDMVKAQEKNFAEYSFSACEYEGKLWAVPWDIGPSAFFYRKDLYDQAGINPPETWDDIVQNGKELQNMDDVDRYIFNIPVNDSYMYFMFIWADNLKLFDADGNLAVDNPEAYEIFEWYVNLARKHEVATLQNFWEPAWWNAIKEGRQVSQPCAVWWAGQLKSQAPELSGKWRVAPWPAKESAQKKTGTNWGGSTLAIPTQSEHLEEAKDFVQYMLMTKEGQLVSYNTSNIFPAFMPALESDIFKEKDEYFGGQPIAQVFIDSIPYISDWYYPPHMQAAEDAFNNLVGEVLTKDVSIKASWDKTIDAIEKEIERF